MPEIVTLIILFHAMRFRQRKMLLVPVKMKGRYSMGNGSQVGLWEWRFIR